MNIECDLAEEAYDLASEAFAQTQELVMENHELRSEVEILRDEMDDCDRTISHLQNEIEDLKARLYAIE